MKRLVVLVLFATAACGGEAAVKRYAANGDAYSASGRHQAAIIEYRNALRRAPQSAEIHRKLAAQYAAVGRLSEAYDEYSRAIEIDPADIAARLETGRLLLEIGRYDEARVRAEEVLDRDPKNVDAHILAGNALANLKRADDALDEIGAAVALDGTGRALAALADVKMAAGDRAGAEASYRAAIAQAPHAVEPRVALAEFLIASSRNGEAETELRQVCSEHPTDELANRAMAALLMATGRGRDAESYLRDAAAATNPRLRSRIALADYYVGQGRSADARNVLERLRGDDAEYAAARVRLSALAWEAGDHREARRLLSETLRATESPEALVLQARFLAADGKLKEALDAARSALDLNPRLAAAQYTVGVLAFQSGQLDEAGRTLRDAAESPSVGDAATLQLVSVELARDELNAAQTAVARLTARHPNHPAVILASARVALATGDDVTAERTLTKAIAQHDTPAGAQEMLAELYTLRGDLDRARATFETIARHDPANASARTGIAMILQAQGRNADAEQWYGRALALDPHDAVAANNLAWLYASDNGRLDEAIKLARTAVERLPNEPEAHDTLGWVLHRAGQNDAAITELEAAINARPEDPSYRYHLAAVLAASGRSEQARTEIDRALSGGPFPERQESERLLATLTTTQPE